MLSDDHERELMKHDMPHRLGIGNNQLLLTEEATAAKNVQIIANAVREVCLNDSEPFKLKRRPNGLHRIEANREGTKLLRAVTHQLPAIEELIPDNVFNPFVEQLRKQLNLKPALRDIPVALSALVGRNAEVVYPWLVDLVINLRASVHSEEFQRELDNRRRQMQKNHRAGIRHIDKIFQERSKVLVIRLDVVTGGETPESRGITQTVDLKLACTEFAKFVRYMRATYPVVGYLRELEYGLLTGYHFHVLIFIDGHLKRNDMRIAQELGEHWKNVITEGRGRYWNCNARPRDYERFALGMTHRSDTLKRKALIEKVLDYLTRKRFWMRLEGVKKTFGKGQFEPREANGRKRAS